MSQSVRAISGQGTLARKDRIKHSAPPALRSYDGPKHCQRSASCTSLMARDQVAELLSLEGDPWHLGALCGSGCSCTLRAWSQTVG